MASEQEEFEFRLRAEREAKSSPPSQEKSDAHPVTSELGPLAKRGGQLLARGALDVAGLPVGLSQTLSNLATGIVGTKGAKVSNTPGSPEWLKSKMPSAVVGPEPKGVMENAVEAAPGFAVPVEKLAGAKTAVDPAVKLLADKGVTMTPGMRSQGFVNSIEQKLTSIPLVGDLIKNARGKSVEQFQRATVDDALAGVGERLPPDAKGAESIQIAGRILDQKYQKLLPQLKGELTGQLQTDWDAIKAGVAQLPAKSSKAVKQVLDAVSKKFTGGKASGSTVQEIRETLRTEADTYRRGGPDDRKVALALDKAKDHLDAMIMRVNPTRAKEYQQLQTAYAKYKIASLASRDAKARGGNATANQYLNAAYKKDRSKDKAAWEKGNALNQELARAGSKVLSSTEPNSGTVDRGLLAAIFLHPGTAIPGLLGSIPMSVLYSQPVLKMFQAAALGGRPVASTAALRSAVPAVSQVNEMGVAQ